MGCVKIFVIVTSVLFVGFSYYLYTPLPDGIAEPWKVRGLMAGMKTIYLLGGLSEAVGLMDSVNMTRTIMNGVARMAASSKSDSLLEVSDTRFDGIPVRIYKPKSRKLVSPCLVYFHGGGWTLGSIDASDKLTSYIAKAANIIVVSVEYRLAPEHPFPIPFDDCVTATLHLIHNANRYGVDEKKVAVAGDSSGANLAAAVALKVSLEYRPNHYSICFQYLMYPALQAFDFSLPSYTSHGSVNLGRKVMTSFWTNYAGLHPDRTLEFSQNNHTSSTLKISKYARYLDPKQLPKKYHTLIPEERDINFGNVTLSEEIQDVLLNPFFAPLMSSDLSKVASAMILTAEFDVLRDDGLLYIERLAKAGVDVVNIHVNDGFHAFITHPNVFKITLKSTEKFLEYAKNKFERCV